MFVVAVAATFLIVGLFLGATAASRAIAEYDAESERITERALAVARRPQIDFPIPPHARTHR